MEQLLQCHPSHFSFSVNTRLYKEVFVQYIKWSAKSILFLKMYVLYFHNENICETFRYLYVECTGNQFFSVWTEKQNPWIQRKHTRFRLSYPPRDLVKIWFQHPPPQNPTIKRGRDSGGDYNLVQIRNVKINNNNKIWAFPHLDQNTQIRQIYRNRFVFMYNKCSSKVSCETNIISQNCEP